MLTGMPMLAQYTVKFWTLKLGSSCWCRLNITTALEPPSRGAAYICTSERSHQSIVTIQGRHCLQHKVLTDVLQAWIFLVCW